MLYYQIHFFLTDLADFDIKVRLDFEVTVEYRKINTALVIDVDGLEKFFFKFRIFTLHEIKIENNKIYKFLSFLCLDNL